MCTQLHSTYFIYTKILISEKKNRICLLSKCWLKWVIFKKILHQYFYRNSYPQRYGKFLFLDAFSERVLPFGFKGGPNGNNCNLISRDDFR